MAKNYQGINGNWSGKVGNNVGAVSCGRTVIRIYQPIVANPRTEAQLAQRARLSAAVAFLKGSAAALRLGMVQRPACQSAFSVAVSKVMAVAISGTYPALSVDPALVPISNGSISLPYNPTATYDSGSIEFVWTDNSGIGDAKAEDAAYIVVRRKDTGDWVVQSGGVRSDRNASYAVPASWAGKVVDVYFFMWRSATQSSPSVYLGQLSV